MLQGGIQHHAEEHSCSCGTRGTTLCLHYHMLGSAPCVPCHWCWLTAEHWLKHMSYQDQEYCLWTQGKGQESCHEELAWIWLRAWATKSLRQAVSSIGWPNSCKWLRLMASCRMASPTRLPRRGDAFGISRLHHTRHLQQSKLNEQFWSMPCAAMRRHSRWICQKAIESCACHLA